MVDVLGVVLGGGKGTRLFPLTLVRCKPAVPLAGKYRIVDIPISNCLNSEIFRIFVLTQFNSASLHRHVAQTYQLGPLPGGFVDILAAEQTMDNLDWFQGTADAVRQSLKRILAERPGHILILSGDQLYRMDYRLMLAHHLATGADITVAVLPIGAARASSFGILKVNEKGRVALFREKPRNPAEVESLRSPASFMKRFQIGARGRDILASMGIYLFKPHVLADLLRNTKMVDFGHELIPHAVKHFKVFVYPFDDYWEDIGTIKAFLQANLDLTGDRPRFNLFDTPGPIFTRPRFLPASRILECRITSSLIADGSILQGSSIERSVVGIRSIIRERSVLRNTLMLGAAYYEGPRSRQPVKLGIGSDCHLQNVIIDKNARIGRGVKVRDHSRSPDFDGPNYYIREGVVVIPKGAVVPDGTEI